MEEYRTAELMNIGTASVIILVLLVAGVAFIYQRCRQLSSSVPTKGTKGTLQAERMVELEELTSLETV